MYPYLARRRAFEVHSRCPYQDMTTAARSVRDVHAGQTPGRSVCERRITGVLQGHLKGDLPTINSPYSQKGKIWYGEDPPVLIASHRACQKSLPGSTASLKEYNNNHRSLCRMLQFKQYL